MAFNNSSQFSPLAKRCKLILQENRIDMIDFPKKKVVPLVLIVILGFTLVYTTYVYNYKVCRFSPIDKTVCYTWSFVPKKAKWLS
jgi:hypothetical protein